MDEWRDLRYGKGFLPLTRDQLRSVAAEVEARKSALINKTATFAARIAFLIASSYFSPEIIFVSSQGSIKPSFAKGLR